MLPFRSLQTNSALNAHEQDPTPSGVAGAGNRSVAHAIALTGWLLSCAFGSALSAAPAVPTPTTFRALESPRDEGQPLLSLEDAAKLALIDQPILSAREATIRADESQARSAEQLPDPKVSGGVKDLPVDGGEALNARSDSFTEYTVGLSQALPRADKRRLQGERKRLEADTERAGLENDRRAIRRDASLAWLDVYEAEQGLALARELTSEAALQSQALEKNYRTGKVPQSEWLATKVEQGLAEDKEHDWLHHAQRARAALERWIGGAAERPLTQDISFSPAPAELAALMAAVDHHPLIGGLDKQIETSATDVAIARQAYKPDVSVEGYFAYRPGYPDFIGIQFTVDLPLFTKNRQDPALAAAYERSHASADRKEDLLRELRAQVNESYVDWQHYRVRAQEFDTHLIPTAARRVEEARAAYGAGQGTFEAVLQARRSLFELQQQRLTLAVEAARARVRLEYFAAPDDALEGAP